MDTKYTTEQIAAIWRGFCSGRPVPGHRLNARGPRMQQTFFCECGQWEKPMPTVGSYGWTTGRAKIGRITMGHSHHIRGVLKIWRKESE